MTINYIKTVFLVALFVSILGCSKNTQSTDTSQIISSFEDKFVCKVPGGLRDLKALKVTERGFDTVYIQFSSDRETIDAFIETFEKPPVRTRNEKFPWGKGSSEHRLAPDWWIGSQIEIADAYSITSPIHQNLIAQMTVSQMTEDTEQKIVLINPHWPATNDETF